MVINVKGWSFNAHDYPFKLESLSQQITPLPLPKPSYTNGFHTKVAPVGIDISEVTELTKPIPPPQIPGLVGEITQYCWNMASSQVAEAAIGSALSMMSLLCSRTYRCDNMGLNLYLLLLSQTSTGKSFMYKSNNQLMNYVKLHYESYQGPEATAAKPRIEACGLMIQSSIGSASALRQHIQKSPSMLWHADEFVHKMRGYQLARNQNEVEIRNELLKLTDMSSPGMIYEPTLYSERSAHKAGVSVYGASLSILGTGTPEDFYSDLASQSLTNGFIPRFTFLEYMGNIPKPNKSVVSTPSYSLMSKLIVLFDHTINMAASIDHKDIKTIPNVMFRDDAHKVMEGYSNHCLRQSVKSNNNKNDLAGLWTRLKEHVLQIACLIAIGCCDPKEQVYIDSQHIHIAWNIAYPGVKRIADKVTNNEVGDGDDRLIADVKMQFARYYSRKFAYKPGFKPELLVKGIIQVPLVKDYCRKLSAFRNHKFKSEKAFNDAFNAIVADGDIIIVKVDGFKYGNCVMLNLETFQEFLSRVKD